MRHFGKFLRLTFHGLAAMLLLSSCAHRDQPQIAAAPVAEPVSGTHVLNPAKSRGVTPVSLEAPLLATTEPYHAPSISPQPPPTKAEQITALVSGGTLVDSKRGVLIFARTKLPKKSSSSLYADAVLLGKVRRSLASAKLPGDFPVTATVADSVACLKLDGERSVEVSAKAIDAALRTAGIAAVEVRLVSAARL